jgi:DNA-binding transcriptional MerR regulator
METVTSKQILDACEIKSVKTLTRWHQGGLIPPPVVGRMPDGTVGKIGKWQPWVLEHCKTIVEMTRSGRRLSEIRELFGSDWTRVAKRYRREYILGDVLARQKAEEVDFAVEAIAKLQAHLARLTPEDIAALLAEADEIYHHGPVLIVTPEAGVRVLSEERASEIQSVADGPITMMRLYQDDGPYD